MKFPFDRMSFCPATWALPVAALGLTAAAQTDIASVTNPVSRLAPVVVVGHHMPAAEGVVLTPAPETRLRVSDSAALLQSVPGAAVVRNGPLTGIVQLRGLSGDRVRVLVDGVTITPACPNHMDPPLHYAPPSAVQQLTVMAGVTPVSHGGDSLAGTVLVESAPPRFATNENTLWFGDVASFYRSSDDGYGFNGAAGVADQNWSGAYRGSWQTANDLRFPGGRVRDTGFDEQQHHDVRAATRTARGLWEVNAGLGRTRDAGTPALPMDMIKDDSWRLRLRQQGDYEFGTIEGRIAFHRIEHLMDNYSLRPLAPGAMRMFSPAESDDWSGGLAVSLPRDRHTFRVGLDFHHNAFDAYQQNAATGARQDTLNEATRTRIGGYGEWQTDWSAHWTTVLGVRNDTVWSDAADVVNAFQPSRPDRDTFNARAHDFTDVNFDLMAALRFTPGQHSRYELAFARKNRAPSLLERYLWTPLSASAGQADGRTYLGNLELDSEVSHQVALTADWHGDRWQVKLTPFFNWVSDYIQGTPISRIVNGQPVLEFQNQNRADLYGVDGEAHYDLTKAFTLRGQLSYVRGLNRATDDNLYRIAPLRGRLALEHRWRGWRSGLEVEMAARQDKVAAYNQEQPTPGYALLHLRAGYTFRERYSVDVSLENLLNKNYADHLGGINRVSGSDVPVGAHLPGAGRFVAVSASCRF
jgi:iron complex outermembrane receptor protein